MPQPEQQAEQGQFPGGATQTYQPPITKKRSFWDRLKTAIKVVAVVAAICASALIPVAGPIIAVTLATLAIAYAATSSTKRTPGYYSTPQAAYQLPQQQQQQQSQGAAPQQQQQQPQALQPDGTAQRRQDSTAMPTTSPPPLPSTSRSSYAAAGAAAVSSLILTARVDTTSPPKVVVDLKAAGGVKEQIARLDKGESMVQIGN
jgi:hypothetical protein